MDEASDDQAPPEECHFCGEPLSASDIVLYGDARAKWEHIAASSPERVGPEPFPTCLECRGDIAVNREALARDISAQDRRHHWIVGGLLFGAILILAIQVVAGLLK